MSKNLQMQPVFLNFTGIQSFSDGLSLKNQSYSVITIDFDKKIIVKTERSFMEGEGDTEMGYKGYWEDGQLCFKMNRRDMPHDDFEETAEQILKMHRFDAWEEEISNFFHNVFYKEYDKNSIDSQSLILGKTAEQICIEMITKEIAECGREIDNVEFLIVDRTLPFDDEKKYGYVVNGTVK